MITTQKVGIFINEQQFSQQGVSLAKIANEFSLEGGEI